MVPHVMAMHNDEKFAEFMAVWQVLESILASIEKRNHVFSILTTDVVNGVILCSFAKIGGQKPVTEYNGFCQNSDVRIVIMFVAWMGLEYVVDFFFCCNLLSV